MMADDDLDYSPLDVRQPKAKAAAAGDDVAPDLEEAVAEARRKSGEARAEKTRSNGLAGDELRQFIERIERLEEEKASIGDDIKDVYGEAKGRGYDTKVMRAIIRIRKQDPGERAEFETILDTYMAALGMV